MQDRSGVGQVRDELPPGGMRAPGGPPPPSGRVREDRGQDPMRAGRRGAALRVVGGRRQQARAVVEGHAQRALVLLAPERHAAGQSQQEQAARAPQAPARHHAQPERVPRADLVHVRLGAVQASPGQRRDPQRRLGLGRPAVVDEQPDAPARQPTDDTGVRSSILVGATYRPPVGGAPATPLAAARPHLGPARPG